MELTPSQTVLYALFKHSGIQKKECIALLTLLDEKDLDYIATQIDDLMDNNSGMLPTEQDIMEIIFSFIMSEDGTWQLAPAYDLTYVLDWGGSLPNEDHCLFMRSKLSNFSREDAVAFAHNNGIQRPDAIIREVADALKQFRPIAEKNKVGARWIGRVESTILDNLKSWGEYDKPTVFLPSEVNGHKISDIRIEQTYRGNYHLLANIDGAERKFVIGKNKEEYAEIEKTGIANITSDQLFEMAKRFFSSALGLK